MQNILLNGYMGVRYNVKSADDDFAIYDLTKDIQEADDLAKNPKQAGLQAAMKARVLQVRVPNASAPRPYDKAPVPPVAQAPTGAPGLSYSLFQGKWPWIPDFRTLKPIKHGTAESLDLAIAAGMPEFGAAFEGYFHAAQPGEYTFTLTTDTGAMVFLHDIRVITERLKQKPDKLTGKVLLAAGWHPIRIYSRHAGILKPALELTCQQGPAGEYKLSREVLRSALS